MEKNITKTVYHFLIILMLLTLPQVCFAKISEAIEVNSTKNALIAPEAKSYQWFYNNEQIPGAIDQELAVTVQGTYKVKLITTDGDLIESQILVSITAAGEVIKVYIIGDSTVSNYKASDYPMAGWGQVFPFFFNTENVQVDNRAIGGRSSRSFYQEGRWTPIKDGLKTGDYVFIQFGHNDRDTKPQRYTSVADYKGYLTRYVNETRAKGAIPVLVSPMVMNAWSNGSMRNVFTENGNNYRGGMLEVATDLKVPFIDLNMKSWNLYKDLGQAYVSRFVYHTYVAGEYSNYPNGITDGTHFQEMGAIDNARLVAEGITDLKNTAEMGRLAQYLKPQYALTINTSPATAANHTTRTATYPAGITVTLKTLPKSGSRFQNWQNGSGDIVATSNLKTVVAGNTAGIYTAMYQGGNCVSTLWYEDQDGDGKGDSTKNILSCTQPVGYVKDKSDQCPSDSFKSLPGSCGCGKTEASCTDCSGTVGGSATLDDCDRCTGGNTDKVPCKSAIEIEDIACSYDGVIETTNTGYKGSSYININNTIGSSITFKISSSQESKALISIRYATTTDRPALIKAENILNENTMAFSATGGFENWKSEDVQIDLLKGDNLLTISATNIAGLPNIDQIGLVSPGLDTGSCLVTGLEGQKSAARLVFSNPFNGHLLLSTTELSLYTVTSTSGRILETGLLQNSTKVGELLPSGIYFLTISHESGADVYKIMKAD